MAVFLQIITYVIFPVFLIIALGSLLHRLLKLDMNTLSKMTTFYLMPTVAFVNMYESKISTELFYQVIGFLIIQNLVLILLSSVAAKIGRYPVGLSATLQNSVVLNNSGNFGLPVSQLVFSNNPLGLSIQVIVTIFQNLLTYTFGLYNSMSARHNAFKAVFEFFKLPIIYAVILGLTFNLLDIQIPFFVWIPIENISSAFLAVALFTLGAQVAYLKIQIFSAPLIFAILGRLIVSPLLAFMLIHYLGLEGIVAQALLIASSYPTSRSSALFALEYNNHPELAAQSVLLTTILSSVTVSAVIWFSKIYFV